MKQYHCKVSFEGFDWRNEFRVQSPTGRIVTLYCNGKWNRMSIGLSRLIEKYHYGFTLDFGWGSWYPELLTYEMMNEILTLSKED